MAVDFSPLLNTNTFDPLGVLARVNELKRNDEMKNMTMYQFLRQKKEDEDQDAINNAHTFKDDGSLDVEGTFTKMSAISPKAAMEFRQGYDKSQADAQDRKINRAEKLYNIMKQSTGYVMANPTLANAVREINRYGMLTGQDVTQELETVNQIGDNPDEIRKWAAGHSLNADQLKPLFKDQDIGGSIQSVRIDPVNGQQTVISSVNKTPTPEAVMTDKRASEEGISNRAVTMRGQDITVRGQNMTDARARDSAASNPNKPTPITPQQQKTNDANEVVNLLKQAAPLVYKATGSGIGSVIDAGQAFFGSSNEGAQSAAQLKAIEGLLVSKMPKMSGPQSDKDVLLYKQMAGQIGDPTIPPDQKAAAMRTINEINARYLGLPPAALEFGAATTKPAPKVAPKLGTVKNGYIFVGGDPASENSWRKK